MKALVVQELSGPAGLVYTDVDDVQDGDETVVIDVRAAGVCFPDLLLTRGEYQLKMAPPFIPGMEVAGVVHSAPEDSGFRPGERVSSVSMLGGYAERVAVPVATVLRSADSLDDGADVVLPMTQGWSKAVRDNTEGRGVDVVVDPVGGEAFDEAVRALATEGRLLVIGFAAGAIPTVGVLGVAWGVGQLVAAGLEPPAPQRYPLSEGRAALESLAAGGVLGKVVLEP
jgi:NADPH:quinone reductase